MTERSLIEVRPALYLDLSKEDLWTKASKAYSSYGISEPNTEADTITWDCIYFGNYPQNDESGNEKEPIKWRVLSLHGTRAVLLADQNLDGMEYCENANTITWEQSPLRSWLNGYGSEQNKGKKDFQEENFIDVAFSEEEKNIMLVTSVTAVDNRVYGTEAGKTTRDRVYLLNSPELVSYFGLKTTDKKGKNFYNHEYPSIIVSNTPYAETKIKNITSGQTKKNVWWLRSPAIYEHYAEFVQFTGRISDGSVSGCLGIRPVIEIDISENNLWTYAGKISSDGVVQEP